MDLPTFDCSRCRHRFEQDEITYRELAGCVALIVAVIAGVRIDAGTIDIDELLTERRRPWREYQDLDP
jgi:hypothetical protein